MTYLSICIPTFNRVDLLRNTLHSITAQSEFSAGGVELVVSDNCSTDGTDVMVREFCDRFPNITYARNAENLGGNVNIHRALALGSGLYRKLSNDTFEFLPGSVGELLRVVKETQNQGAHLLFSNGRVTSKDGRLLRFEGIDRFVGLVSYEITWDGLIGFWNHEFSEIVSKEDPEAWFWTLRAILKILEASPAVVVCPTTLFVVRTPAKKDISYGLIKAFYGGYLGCLRPYLGRGLTSSTFQADERKLIYRFFLRWLTRKEVSRRFVFSEEDTVAGLEQAAGRRLIGFRLILGLNVGWERLRRRLGSLVHRARPRVSRDDHV